MSTTKSSLRRLVAGAAALTLGVAGALSLGSVASADQSGNINPGVTGSIIIHKHVKDEASTDGNPLGAALAGVTFRVTEVLKDGASIPLATAEGWTAIEDLQPADVPGAGFTLGTSEEVTTDDSGMATADELKVGLYLIEETGSGSNLIEAPAAPFLVTIPNPSESGWDYEVDVYPKNVLGKFAPSKTVGTPDSPADVQLGATVPFTISVPVAKHALPYTSLSITDALSANLEFVSWSEIKIGDTALVAADYTVSADNKTVSLTPAGLTKLNNATTTASSTVSAVITAKVIGLGQLMNEASASLNGTVGETPEVTTNWAGLEITKKAEQSAAVLAGATFELYKADKTTLLATGTTGTDGKLSFTVWVGNNEDVEEVVYLKETVAPTGYVLPADPWSQAITLRAGETSVTAVTIENKLPEGPNLPLTGAAGTAAMSLGGLLLVGLGVGAVLLTQRRRAAL